VLVYISAWPLGRIAHWKTMLPSRAVENQVYVVASNRVGSEEDITLGGSSCIIDPNGNVLAQAGETEEELLVVELDAAALAEAREGVLLRDTLRADVYQKLIDTD